MLNENRRKSIKKSLEETQKALDYYTEQLEKNGGHLSNDRATALAVLVLPKALQCLLNAVESLYTSLEEEDNKKAPRMHDTSGAKVDA